MSHAMQKLEPSNLETLKNVKVITRVDVESVSLDRPEQAVKHFVVERKPKVLSCDLLIVGGGTGGVAAALAACSAGLDVCLSEETSWLGGQMTAQGVSALDENYLVESSGATRTYKLFRTRIRKHYRALGGKDGLARFEKFLDPGNCWVSRLAFEPKVAVEILDDFLAPHVRDGRLEILKRNVALDARIQESKVRAVQFGNFDSGEITEVRCRFCLDATELGDMFPLLGVPYYSGVESRDLTGEAHAPEIADTENVQDFTYPFAIELCPGENHTIEKPLMYEEFKQAGKFSLLGYAVFKNQKGINEHGKEVEYLPFWEYRRLIESATFPASQFPRDIAMINWESNDLRGENIIDAEPTLMSQRLARAKNLSLGFLYWMQTELKRDDGGVGYPEFKLREDVMGTADGVSKYPYIRESRRLATGRFILEMDIIKASNSGARAKVFGDSLGIGLYPVDIHGKQDVPGAAQTTAPFQIPAFAFVPQNLRNFLPACKNISCTHVTNGAYRLHPIEWAIGEAAAMFAVEVLENRTDVQRFHKSHSLTRRLQRRLLEYGAPIVWFNDLAPEEPEFAAIQFLSICKIMPIDSASLAFRPDDFLSRAELAQAMERLCRGVLASQKGDSGSALNSLFDCAKDAASSKIAVNWKELQLILTELGFPVPTLNNAQEFVRRREFALLLYPLAASSRFIGRC